MEKSMNAVVSHALLALDEGEEVAIDDVRVRRAHSMG
jgi:hypothetical protein